MKPRELLFMFTRTAPMLLLTSSISACAGPRPPPPAEALEACRVAASGDACTFTAPHGAVAGTCWAPPGKPLACKPAEPPPRRQDVTKP